MNKLVIHPTEMSQWYSLVSEAQAITRIFLNEQVESYLVFLLMRFTQNACFTDSVLAYDFLNSINKSRTLQLISLKEVGDKSLLFCGLFPDMVQKRRLKLNYFSSLGKTAYLIVSELEDKAQHCNNVYIQLSQDFFLLQHVLNALRQNYTQ